MEKQLRDKGVQWTYPIKEKINYCIMPLTGTLWFFVIRLIERTTNLLSDPETVEMSLFFIHKYLRSTQMD